MSDPFIWLALVAVPGHISWIQWCSNNLHAVNLDYRFVKRISPLINTAIVVGATALPAWALVRFAATYRVELPIDVGAWGGPLSPAARGYVGLCVLNTLVCFLPWLIIRLTWRESEHLLADEYVRHDLCSHFGGAKALALKGRLLTRLPYNQGLQLCVHRKRILVPRLPRALNGLRIAHLSDLHLAGVFECGLYERLVRLTNEARADIVALTGDLIEKPACWDWIASTFGTLVAPHGIYFVLGNHDIRIDHTETVRRLVAAGLRDLGRGYVQTTIRGVDVLLAGNELPWLGPPPEVPRQSRIFGPPQFRVLLSHSPDQYSWARERDFDLVLAGHVHGGQIQFPILGPVLAPSKFGVHYASGVFYEPPTVMHVSRGTSNKLPLRYFCPPELAILELVAPASDRG